MKKIVLTGLFLSLFVGTAAFAESHNPFDEMYKQQSKREACTGVAQYNYMLIDENSRPIANAALTYVNRDNRQFVGTSDAKGRVHLEFKQPNFIQLDSVVINNVSYRVIGEDISDNISYKDIAKGDVEYYVLQKHSANVAMYAYDAD